MVVIETKKRQSMPVPVSGSLRARSDSLKFYISVTTGGAGASILICTRGREHSWLFSLSGQTWKGTATAVPHFF